MSVFVFLIVIDVMGQMASSPLDVLLTPYLDINVQVHKLSVLMKKSKLVLFCRLAWPTFNVGWCPEETFDLAITVIIKTVEETVFRPWLGHPN